MRSINTSQIVVTISLGAILSAGKLHAQQAGDTILGMWKSEEKVLTIEVYRQGTEYRGKIVSFTDHHNNTPSDQRVDEKNPNPSLRNRKMIGMDVLYGLSYDTDANIWRGGRIYDAGSGKKYNVTLELTADGKLEARAYAGIRLLGKSMTFSR